MRENSSPCHSVQVHTNPPPTPASKPTLGGVPPEEKPPRITYLPFPERNSPLRLGLICLILAVGLGAVLTSALHSTERGALGGDGGGQAQGQDSCEGGLPSGGEGKNTADEGQSDVIFDSEMIMTDRQEVTAYETYVTESPLPGDTEPEADDSESPTNAPEESRPEPETTPPVPAGCYPIVPMDMSERDRGAGYIAGDASLIPGRLPGGDLWSVGVSPTVLVVHTHPYEGYSDGDSWYDPAEGGLAVTETPDATDGIVAMGAMLTRALRNNGVTVIHVRIAVSPADTATDIYARTETVIRYYCSLYSDVGLVLNLRRSAELTPEGGVLRTEGDWGGEPCAQLRISVNGGRSTAAVGRDLTMALAIRRELWDLEPSLSRPVGVKSGRGLVPDLSDVRVLTVDIGSAGNTYAEGKRLVPPLAAVLEKLLRENQ